MNKLIDFDKHPVISSIISSIPGIWATIMTILSGWKDGLFTGWLILVSIVLLVVYFIYFYRKQKRIYNRNNEVAAGQKITHTVMDSIDVIVDEKIARYDNDIIKNNHIENHAEDQVHIICSELQRTISEIMDVERPDIGISIVYGKKCCSSDTAYQFRFLHQLNLGNDKCDIEDITSKESESAIKDIIYKNKQEVFFVKKKEAYDKKQYYIKEGMEDTLQGSVYCKKINYGKDTEHCVILCISTHTIEICNNTEAAKRIFTDVIIPPFVKRLRIELLSRDYSA